MFKHAYVQHDQTHYEFSKFMNECNVTVDRNYAQLPNFRNMQINPLKLITQQILSGIFVICHL